MSIDAQKNELDMLEAEVITRVRAKLMHQFLMKRTASWTPQKDIDLFLKYMELYVTVCIVLLGHPWG